MTQTKQSKILQQIQQMNVSEKIKLAAKGDKEARSILIRDSNKEVAMAVISSPKISEPEIEKIASLPHISEEILRYIGSKRAWCLRHNIISTLINNPKTPVGISLPLVKRLNKRELDLLNKNKRLPQVIRAEALRLLATR